MQRMDKSKHEKALFWKKVVKSEGCWLWSAAKVKSKKVEYGFFGSRYWTGRKKMYNAHRLAYEFTHDVILKKTELVCHKCENSLCCRPGHMFIGSQKDNMSDAKKKGRTCTGEKHGRSKITESAAKEIRRLAFGGINQNIIAAKFNISRSHVAGIKAGTKWGHLRETT